MEVIDGWNNKWRLDSLGRSFPKRKHCESSDTGKDFQVGIIFVRPSSIAWFGKAHPDT
jgi:hypothetical protein